MKTETHQDWQCLDDNCLRVFKTEHGLKVHLARNLNHKMAHRKAIGAHQNNPPDSFASESKQVNRTLRITFNECQMLGYEGLEHLVTKLGIEVTITKT